MKKGIKWKCAGLNSIQFIWQINWIELNPAHFHYHKQIKGAPCKKYMFGKIIPRENFSLKGEIHSKIESILKERVHFFLQNSEKMMKIGWEIRKIWHFEISHFFRKTLLDQSLWIFKWASWWCHPLTIFHIYILYMKLWKILIFSSYR